MALFSKEMTKEEMDAYQKSIVQKEIDRIERQKEREISKIEKKKDEFAQKFVKKVEEKNIEQNYLIIEGLKEIVEEIRRQNSEMIMNPLIRYDRDPLIVHLNGEQFVVINDKYVPYNEAEVIFQKQKVVREYLKLQNLISK